MTELNLTCSGCGEPVRMDLSCSDDCDRYAIRIGLSEMLREEEEGATA